LHCVERDRGRDRRVDLADTRLIERHYLHRKFCCRNIEAGVSATG
jgi:hypothetical protein